MTITFDTSTIYKGENSVQDLGDEVNKALQDLAQHTDGSQAWVKGMLMEALLHGHAEFVADVDRGLVATRKCLRSTSDALNDVGIDVLTGWSDGAGADVPGEYFARLVAVMAGQTRVYADLDRKYTDTAEIARMTVRSQAITAQEDLGGWSNVHESDQDNEGSETGDHEH